MITETIENRIDGLSPKARKLFLVKLRTAIAFASAQNDSNQRKRIVVYVQGHENFSVDQLKADLKKKLPDYMVPSQFISLEAIPLLPNGKINRKQLASTVVPVVKPKPVTTNNAENTIEQQLLAIWEETLGFSPIRRDDNFFEIGGDSILSIQIVAKARRKGIILTANDLFDHQTVAELSLFAKVETSETNRSLINGVIPLSPIQHWFFKYHKNAPQYWNQAIKLDNLPKASEQQIKDVCDYIIAQHDTLRSRFNHIENKWIQEIIEPEQICALEYIDLSNIETTEYKAIVDEKTQRIQDQFNLSKGSLFKCLYFGNSASANDFCILIAHHLVVDAVSWQIISDDFTTALEEVVTNKVITKESKTSSSKDWTAYLTTYTDNVSKEELEFWQSQIVEVSSLPVDKNDISVIEEKDIEQLHFSFDKLTTEGILKANQAYHTKTEELLITAFIASIGNWSTHKEIAIGFERHGRETSLSKLDMSKTVGWFTSYFPLKFAYQLERSIDDQIINAKEKMRSIPTGGIGYGGLRYLKNIFGDIRDPEIVFNFLGTQTNSQTNNTIKRTTLTSKLRDPQSERHYKLEVNIGIVDGILNGSFSFGKQIHHEETIATLINDFKKQIQTICDHCNQVEKGRYTPSDFTDVEINQDDLDSLMDLLT